MGSNARMDAQAYRGAIMKYAAWLIALCFAILLIDYAVARLQSWHTRRAELIKNERLYRYNVAAFRGTRKFDDPRWPT